jgi:hypothetical protein
MKAVRLRRESPARQKRVAHRMRAVGEQRDRGDFRDHFAPQATDRSRVPLSRIKFRDRRESQLNFCS